MNELVVKVIFGLVRLAAAPVMLWLNNHDIITSDETLQVIMLIATLAAAGIGTVFNKVWLLRERNTALAMPELKTPEQIKALINRGKSAPASVPADAVPYVKASSMVALVLVPVLLLTACAGNRPPSVQPGTLQQKATALAAAAAAQSTLKLVQDTVRRACDFTAFQSNPSAPITECRSTLAQTIGLTTPKFQAFSAAMAKAYEAHKRAVTALDNWRPGQPAPSEIGGFESEVTTVLALLRTLSSGNAEGATLLSIGEALMGEATRITLALRQ